MNESNNQIHIAIIPNSGAGHLIPLIEFARHLLLHNPRLFFTFIIIPSTPDAAITPSALALLPTNTFNFVKLPPPSFPAFSDIRDEIFSRVLQTINRSLPLLRQTLEEIAPIKALIVDIFATDIIQVGLEMGIKSCVFYSASAIALSMFLHLPKKMEEVHDGEWGLDDPLNFLGCPMVQVKDLPEPLNDHKSIHAKWFSDHCKRFESSEAIILNSFEGLEEEPIRALVAKTVPPVHVVGPLVRVSVGSPSHSQTQTDSSGCLRWLDGQPLGSVLYVSFGSGGTLSTNQMTELALGLELSHQRFLWVVRSPNDSVANGTLLSFGGESNDPLGVLPQGFVERTQGRGLVVGSWAPQAEILSHGSTGGFLSHCGWNSILEGVVNGVGFIAWPLYAEQRMNAIELVEKVKVALRVDKNKDGVVERVDVAKVVKELMEGGQGMEIKTKMSKLKHQAMRRIQRDGASNVALSKLAHMWN